MDDENIVWRFFGYCTPAEGKPVQDWYDDLGADARDEAQDTIGYLQRLKRRLWKEPTFEAFDSKLSEIKFKDSILKKWYRIYGTFWPENRRYSYTFLLGKEKKTKNDARGKKLALERLKRLRRGEAMIHVFEFNIDTNC